MKRVAIVGCSGAGKSLLAIKLGEMTGLPVIHLDREYWRPGWKEPTRFEWIEHVMELAKGERWIIDGNYSGTMDIRFEVCDTIVFMDYPRNVCLMRVLKRVLRYYGRRRPDMPEGCNERFDLLFMKWIWNYRKKVRPLVLTLIEEYASGRDVHILKSDRDTKRFWEMAAEQFERS
jgi:adenylate kinase family enzyme